MNTDLERVLFSAEQLDARVKELGKLLSADYAERNPVLACILKGSVLFYADLARAISCPITFDFIKASSYGMGAVSAGALTVEGDLSTDVEGRDVILVEDILDTGNTLNRLKQLLLAREPASLKIVTLLDKPSRRTAAVKADYVGFEIEDEFVVGYGLDYAERYRNLPYVGVLKRSVYEK